jgi:lipopolysaccharide biosynthesis glycosyltransferase
MPKDLSEKLGKSVNGYFSLLLLDRLDQDFLWLDSDLLLAPGWDSIFEAVPQNERQMKYVIAAVKDRIATTALLRKESKNSAFINNPDRYFNCGLMWLSPRVWKENMFDRKWGDVIRNDKELGLQFIDQDILNFMLSDHVTLLPNKFNYIPGDVIDQSPLITHYAGYPKPWVLSARGKALYLMAEAINWNRPQFRPSREGKFKTEYFQYWKAEDDLLADLRLNRPDLYEETLAKKRLATREINFLEKIKYAIARVISIEFINFISRKKPTLTGNQILLWQDEDELGNPNDGT